MRLRLTLALAALALSARADTPPLRVYNAGTILALRYRLNCTGALTCSDDSANSRTTVTIATGAGGKLQTAYNNSTGTDTFPALIRLNPSLMSVGAASGVYILDNVASPGVASPMFAVGNSNNSISYLSVGSNTTQIFASGVANSAGNVSFLFNSLTAQTGTTSPLLALNNNSIRAFELIGDPTSQSSILNFRDASTGNMMGALTMATSGTSSLVGSNGAAGSGSTAGKAASALNITAGNGGTGTSTAANGAGGAVTIVGGDEGACVTGGTCNAAPGTVTINGGAGAATITGTAGQTGATVIVRGGAGGTGVASAAAGQGGTLQMLGGTGGANSGTGSSSGTGGTIIINAGAGGAADASATTAGAGGAASFRGGAGATGNTLAAGGTGGATTYSSGPGGPGTAANAAGAGGAATLSAGQGGTNNGGGGGAGGNLTIKAGTATGAATHGTITMGATGTSAIGIGASGVTTTFSGDVTLANSATALNTAAATTLNAVSGQTANTDAAMLFDTTNAYTNGYVYRWRTGQGSGSVGKLMALSTTNTATTLEFSRPSDGNVQASFLFDSSGITNSIDTYIPKLFLTGSLNMNSKLLQSPTAPTVSSGFGTGASITANNGTTAFRVGVGTTTANTGVIGLPTASTGWNCTCNDITTTSTTVFLCKQTASTTASATVGNFSDIAVAGPWVDSDVLAVSCFAY